MESKKGSKGEDFALVSPWGAVCTHSPPMCMGGLGHRTSVSPPQTWIISPDCIKSHDCQLICLGSLEESLG